MRRNLAPAADCVASRVRFPAAVRTAALAAAETLAPILTGLCLLAGAPGLGAQQEPPTLETARPFLQAEDWAGAAEVLAAVTASDPENARAWHQLGIARYELRLYDGGIEAMTRADELGFAPALVRYISMSGTIRRSSRGR